MLTQELVSLAEQIQRLACDDHDKQALLASVSALQKQAEGLDAAAEPSLAAPGLIETSEFSTASIMRDSRALLDFMVSTIAERYGFDFVAVLLMGEDQDTLTYSAVNTPQYQYLVDSRQSVVMAESSSLHYAVQNSAACVIEEIDKTTFVVDRETFPATCAELVIPLITDGVTRGVIDIRAFEPVWFDEETLQNLETFAIQSSAALVNAQLLESERNQRKLADTLRNISLVIGTIDQDDLFELILEQLGRLIAYDAAALWLDNGDGVFHVAASLGYEKFNAQALIAQRTLSAKAEPLVADLLTASKILTVPDAHREPRWRQYEGFEWVRSWIGVRITVRGRIIGLLTLDHSQPNFYSAEDRSLLEAFVAQILIGFENAQLLESERRQREISSTLRDIGLVLASTLDFQQVLQSILEQVKRVLPYDAAGVWLDDGHGRLKMVVGLGYEQFGLKDLSSQLTFPRLKNPFLGDLDSAKRAMIMPDVTLVDGYVPIPGYEWVRSWASALLIVKDRAIGYLALDHRQPNFYGPQYESVLEILATQFSIAIENAQLYADLQQTMHELKRSNDEMQQFVYVASHDLQEPLRVIASYVQLISRRYKGKLDSDADEFINFAVDGAHRMQGLINDLLTYSRVGTQAQPFEIVNCERILDDALANLQLAIEDSHAEISREDLPTLMGVAPQLTSVFQNLIGNAIKFRGSKAPQIRIACQKQDENWLFSVKDNGIGIAPEYADRIFIIFKRLHTAAEYPGTGLGLAITKKVIERHGGRIWVESQVEQGATFYFALPARMQ